LVADKILPLHIPVAGVEPQQLRDSFAERRGSDRAHEALDIPAPQGTAVFAASAGRIVKLFRSVRGGITLYQKDPTGLFILYYAHLDRYADGIREGRSVQAGEVLGYVGATGNASPDAPHLHFAVWRVCDPRNWWQGTPVNPYPLLQPTP
jgi:murein DD-endopeptidase MepM/ murein hydrolase activator NlpD